jgi:hypothetical protein
MISLGLMMLMIRDFHDGGISLFTVISTHLIGLLVGLVGWWDGEGKYKKALIQGRVIAAPGGKIAGKPYLFLNTK